MLLDLRSLQESTAAAMAAAFQRTDPDRKFRRTDPTRILQRADPESAFRRALATRAFQRTDPDRKFRRTDPTRSFRKANPVSAQVQYQTRTKKSAEVVAFPFDFSNFPEVLAGETLSAPSVPAVAGLTIGTPTISNNVVDGIPIGQALSVTISGGTAGTDYTVTAYVNTSGGATRAVTGVVAVR